MNKKIVLLLVSIFFSAAAFAAEPSLDTIVNNIRGNQDKIKDLYSETTTKITSNLQLPTSKGTGPQTMTQQGKMWSKGEDKSKIEMLSPMHQITITNGDKMAIINPDTGQKMVQDLKKMGGQFGGGSQGRMSLDKMKEMFDLGVRSGEDGQYIITGVPLKENKFLGKMEFYVDSAKWIPARVMMYDAKGKLISQTDITYQQIGGAWVPAKNVSNVIPPSGSMKVEMEYSNIKVNKGISDKEFNIE